MDSDNAPQLAPAIPPHTVALFHGLCATPLELAFLANHLRQCGFLVETPTFEGYGYGTPASHWQDWVTQATQFIRELQKDRGGSISLGGLSMGATLALGVSTELHDICSVSALSTTLQYDGWSVPWYHFLLPLAEKIGFGRIYEYKEREPFGVKNEQLRAYVKKSLINNKVSEVGGDRMSLKHLAEAEKLCKYVRQRLPLINTNLLLIHAVDDEVASTRNVDIVMNSVSSAVKEAIFLGNSYHIVTVDNERETVCSEVEFFLSGAVARCNGQNNKKLFPVVAREWARYLRQKK